jgi:D-3-phosphoglycerate dehydrogenase
LIDVIDQYNALVVRSRTKVTADVLAAASRLKIVGRAGVGVDNIDLAAAKAQQVIVVNAPTASRLAVAELTIGLLFSLARAIPRADASIKAGQWVKKELQGIELCGKTLGVIGMGNIGTLVAQRSIALGMSTFVYDPSIPPAEIVLQGAQPVSIGELFAQSDFITLHVPLTTETRGMIGEHALSQMKPGVRLVCTARGGIIDETALQRALESGHVAGAALDVFAKEPPAENALVSHPNLIATPHIGAQTAEAQARVAADIAYEVLAALQNKPLRWRVA